MSWFPAIARPCPVADRLDTVMTGNDCRHCGQTVHNLDGTTEAQRRRLMAKAAGELCVRYSRPLAKAVLATVALGSGALVHAQQTPRVDADAAAPAPADARIAPISSVVVKPLDESDDAANMEIIVGGAARRIPAGYEYVESTAAEDRRDEKAAERAAAREQRRLAARARRAAKTTIPVI
ncbi:hypothetical protein [Sphingomonas sp. SUN039]|uniref:hypothetical protein n=1 Tax=Sphingomonas sp. SUN039 TaxID=2937787 RepID=UPI0021646250|nr:hypothetical protein [Sphingomonas sp. SUN039]UVO53284.1 hypothetical protein M0209_03780 [Sphingomonas sp. SUN039]